MPCIIIECQTVPYRTIDLLLLLSIYCVEVWGNACDAHLDPIIKIKYKWNVFELSLSHITWNILNLYLETWRFSPSKNWWFRELRYWCLNIVLVLCQNLLPHYLRKKGRCMLIILDIVARFIYRLVNLKQHIELLVIMQKLNLELFIKINMYECHISML